MGNYRITINAVGGHGQDRSKKSGEIVDFTDGRTKETHPHNQPTPESIILEAIEKLKATGNSVSEATVHHWPGQDKEIVDNLLTGKRIGEF